MRRNIFYGWWVLGASVISMALGSGVSFWAFGLYIEPLEADFGWSRTEVSLGFSASLLVAGLSGPFIGRWIDIRGPRQVIIVGAALTAVTYVLLATTSTLWQFYLYLTINAVFRQMMFFIPFQSLISRWFHRRRGIALGVLGTGFSMGGLIVVPIMRAVIDWVGWEGSFVFAGVMTLAVFVPLGFFVIRNNPSDVGTFPDGEPLEGEDASQPRAVEGLTLGEAIRTPLFWTLAAAFMLFFYGLFGWLVHQVPFYESVGISRAGAANIVATAAGLGVLARLGFGFIVDRIGRVESAAMVLTAFLMASMMVLFTSTAPFAIALFVAFWVVGAGGGPLLEPLLLPRAFGLAHFGSILGAIVVVTTTGMVISPTVAGAIFDATGSYNLVLLMLFSAFAGSFFFFFLARRLPRPYVPSPAAQREAAAPVPPSA